MHGFTSHNYVTKKTKKQALRIIGIIETNSGPIVVKLQGNTRHWICFRVHRRIRAGVCGHVYSPSEAIDILLSNIL